MLLYKYKFGPLPPTVKVCVARRSWLFSRIFSCVLVESRPEEDLFLLRARRSQRMREKIHVNCLHGPPQTILLRPGKGMNIRSLV
jgi:hypothetical protein